MPEVNLWGKAKRCKVCKVRYSGFADCPLCNPELLKLNCLGDKK